MPDPIILDRATELQRVVFTQDEDFLAIANRRQQEEVNFAGVIYSHQQIDERNFTFHSWRGLQETDVFKAWITDSREQGEARVLGCLNFVSGETFGSLKKARLRSQVHDELVDAIARYELQN